MILWVGCVVSFFQLPIFSYLFMVVWLVWLV